MDPFCEVYLLCRSLSYRNFLVLNAFLHILPHFVILLYVLSGKHALLSFNRGCLGLVFFGNLFYDFTFIFLNPFLLSACYFLSLFFLQHSKG